MIREFFAEQSFSNFGLFAHMISHEQNNSYNAYSQWPVVMSPLLPSELELCCSLLLAMAMLTPQKRARASEGSPILVQSVYLPTPLPDLSTYCIGC